MAFVLTYDSLTTTIRDYVERQDPRFLSSIPVFIMLGQRNLARDLKILNFKNVVTDALQTGVQIVEKPGDWLNTSYINIGTGTSFLTKVPLELRTQEYCDTYWPDETQIGTPKYFCDFTFNTFKVVPTPDQNYPYQLSYWNLPALLDETNGTNIITATIPDPLLYRCLLETASFLKDDERLPIWTDYYTKSIQSVTKEDVDRINVGFNTQSH